MFAAQLLTKGVAHSEHPASRQFRTAVIHILQPHVMKSQLLTVYWGVYFVCRKLIRNSGQNFFRVSFHIVCILGRPVTSEKEWPDCCWFWNKKFFSLHPNQKGSFCSTPTIVCNTCFCASLPTWATACKRRGRSETRLAMLNARHATSAHLFSRCGNVKRRHCSLNNAVGAVVWPRDCLTPPGCLDVGVAVVNLILKCHSVSTSHVSVLYCLRPTG